MQPVGDLVLPFNTFRMLVIIIIIIIIMEGRTVDLDVTGASLTGTTGFLVGMTLGKTLQSPNLFRMKPRKDINNVSRGNDVTEIALNAV